MLNITNTIAEELSVRPQQVDAAIKLLDEGSTVPFISRYRKEATDSLDDQQLRVLNERLQYFRDLEDRRATILKSIEQQEKLTPELKKQIDEADTKTRLEDLYLPYKPKRRTKGQAAIEAGLEPLADSLFTAAVANDESVVPETLAPEYFNEEHKITTVKEALDGAKFILMERFAEDADLLASLRQRMNDEAALASTVIDGQQNEGEKFKDYFEYSEAFKQIPSHRALAIFRGQREGVLSTKLDLILPEGQTVHPAELLIAARNDIDCYSSKAVTDASVTSSTEKNIHLWIKDVVRWTWQIKLHLQITSDLMSDLRSRAEEDAIQVFAKNLQDLLLAAPAGQRATLGLDPGLRTGVKIAVIDNTGQYRDTATIYPHVPKKQWAQSIEVLAKFAKQYKIELVAIGNGTASRETDQLVADLMKQYPELGLTKIMVSEAGASVYSASELAAEEFPDLDVTVRGAISIARRLQDPLSELVKIEAKAIGVGQYQHDVSQFKLSKSLDAVIEDCVNAVGVEINTASAQLLKYVAGISSNVAKNIVAARDANGAITSRAALKDVSGVGAKTFEQCAGFLRVRQSENPLDNSAVHPESYPVVQNIADQLECDIKTLVGNKAVLKSANADKFVNDETGLVTVTDILAELEKPGLDPRPQFETAVFKEGVESLKDLQEDMVLEGVITNVTNFGAFVDIGVHQDGLVHISALADKFVKDPREVVKTGQIVKVKVMEVDVKRKRIGLSMRLTDSASEQAAEKTNQNNNERPRNTKPRNNQNRNNAQAKPRTQKKEAAPANNAFAAAFAKAQKKG